MVAGGRLQERVAVVTGAAGGIGAAIVERFLAEGACVVAADINLEGATALAATAARGRVMAAHLDVADEQGCHALAERTQAEFGRLDILINNAGAFPAKRFDEISYQDWRQVMATNLDGAFLMTRSVIPMMKKA